MQICALRAQLRLSGQEVSSRRAAQSSSGVALLASSSPSTCWRGAGEQDRLHWLAGISIKALQTHLGKVAGQPAGPGFICLSCLLPASHRGLLVCSTRAPCPLSSLEAERGRRLELRCAKCPSLPSRDPFLSSQRFFYASSL